MSGKYNWHGDLVQARIRAEMARRVDAACNLVEVEAKLSLNVAGTGKHAKTFKYRDKEGNIKTKRKGSRIYGSSPSAPGEPPHKQLGHLRRSVTREVVELVGRVGTNLNYGRWLELGTRLMKARPWLRRALRQKQDAAQAILSAPMKGGS